MIYRFAVVYAFLLTLPTCVWSQVVAPGNVEALLRRHLEAGEFGPAQQLAFGADAGARDRLLNQIALAQAAAGGRRASVGTAGLIADDLARTAAMNGIASQPAGGFLGRGGAALADFDSLMNLITSTIAPESWDDVGGPGAVEPFPGGVFVDGDGVLRKALIEAGDTRLSALRTSAIESIGNVDVRRASAMRKVSVTRLERHLQARAALGLPADESMLTLAGLQKIQYVFVYPETRDIVIAGPAGNWTTDVEGRPLSMETGRPLMHLDDLVVVLRNAFDGDGRFGCSITPKQENLLRTKAFLETSAGKAIKPTQRDSWLEDLRKTVGKQDIQVFGIDPRTRTARVIVEADYRMKLVGMGLEEGVLGVTSYLALLEAGEVDQPMNVLRWWFTLNYDALRTTENHDAYELHGQGVKVLSENEFLNETGERVHTGKSDEPTAEFAHTFTKHFPELAKKYPIYAELQNIFDLALVASLLQGENAPELIDWKMPYFGPNGKYQPQLGLSPMQVESVINHRVMTKSKFVAGVSGGVTVDPKEYVTAENIKLDEYGGLKAARGNSAPKNVPANAWWWD
jgi:hypothetical protein